MQVHPDDLPDLEGQWVYVTHVGSSHNGRHEHQSNSRPWRLKQSVFFRRLGLVLVFDRGLEAFGELVLQWQNVVELTPVWTDVLAKLDARTDEV